LSNCQFASALIDSHFETVFVVLHFSLFISNKNRGRGKCTHTKKKCFSLFDRGWKIKKKKGKNHT